MTKVSESAVSPICLHGHFYQPDRDDPWTGQVPPEASASPYRDWNERIDAECYRPNAAARRLGPDGRIVTITSNYERISWNAGPSLMRWLERHDPWTHDRLVDADHAGAARFASHGPAMAHPWVHAILPLCDPADRRTLIRWGIVDFERRFGRRPEGLWLPETAVDTATLDELAAQGVLFTVLAPWQLRAVTGPEGAWRDVDASRLDTTRPYRCELPSGRDIAVWCYDGSLSAGIAFGGWLDDGHRLAGRFRDAAGRAGRRGLVHVATDGESYGHHHRWGEMALAAALDDLESDPGCRLTVYGEQLERDPPAWQARLAEPTAWSCAHGVERWRSDCGCHTGGPAGWNQAWRAPLRQSLDWLRGVLCQQYETLLEGVVDDPWATRDDYGRLLALPPAMSPTDRRSAEDAFLGDHGATPAARALVLGALELQRHVLMAFESSAWFFNDLAGLEPTMALRHAARAIDLAVELGGRSVEADLVERLALARANDPDHPDGAAVWRDLVRRSSASAAAAAAPAAPDAAADRVPGVEAAIELLADPDRRDAASVAIENVVRRRASEVGSDDAAARESAAARILGIERLAVGLGLAELPGRWWVQNEVIACRDRLGVAAWSGSFAVLAERVGVAPPV